MNYLPWLLIHGALMGMIYTLIAVTFVIVYKSTCAANFAVGEWVMLGASFTAAGQYPLVLFLEATFALLVAMIPAGFAMMAVGVGVARIAAVPMRLRSPMAMIMLTLGLGSVIRGGGTILVLNGVSLTAQAGKITTLLGANGAGTRRSYRDVKRNRRRQRWLASQADRKRSARSSSLFHHVIHTLFRSAQRDHALVIMRDRSACGPGRRNRPHRTSIASWRANRRGSAHAGNQSGADRPGGRGRFAVRRDGDGVRSSPAIT